MPNIRVVVTHTDANNKIVGQQESFLLTVATVDQNGINTVLTNNSKKKGVSFIVHSYANLDKEHANSVNLLT